MRTGAPLANARMTPGTPTPAPRSALPAITGCRVSPAPWVPTFSSTRLSRLKMPASWPSVGAWFSQLLIWPIATLSWSSPRAGAAVKPVAASTARLEPRQALSAFLTTLNLIGSSSSFPLTPSPRFRRPRARHRCGLRPRLEHRARRESAGPPQAQRPMFPRPVGYVGHRVERAGEPGFARGQCRDLAEELRAQLILRVVAHEDRARHQLAHIAADHGRAVIVHQHRTVRPSSVFTTSRLVSPNSSRWFQNGTVSPAAAPRWKTGTMGTPAI